MVKRGRPPADWLYRVLDIEWIPGLVSRKMIADKMRVSENAIAKQFERLGIRVEYTKNTSGGVLALYNVKSMSDTIRTHVSRSDNPDFLIPVQYRKGRND